ncbi:MAG: hypothetical protein ABIH92_00915 [Nanoarchaeota archaeon]
MTKGILLFVVVLSAFSVSALQFSPASLEFDLEIGEFSCKKVNVWAETERVEVSDVWASDFDDEWSISGFDTEASELGLDVDYPHEIFSEDEISVCISGTSPGDYKGALVFRQEGVGSSIVQFVVWLRVSISGEEDGDDSGEEDETEDEDEVEEDSLDNGGSSRSSGGSSGTIWKSLSERGGPSAGSESDFQELSADFGRIRLQGSVSEKKTGLIEPGGLVFLLVISFILMAVFLFLLVRIPLREK